jgi:hypothetical protein
LRIGHFFYAHWHQGAGEHIRRLVIAGRGDDPMSGKRKRSSNVNKIFEFLADLSDSWPMWLFGALLTCPSFPVNSSSQGLGSLRTPNIRNARKRLGRPPGSAETARTHRVVTFVTDSEFEQLQKLADASGKSFSAILHGLVSTSLVRPAPSSSDAPDDP